MAEEKESGGNSQVGALLQVNNLDYRIPPALSVAVSRAHAKYPLSQAEVKQNGEMIFVLPSGSHYVDFRNSYIKFTVTVTPVDSATTYTNIRTFNNGYRNSFQTGTAVTETVGDPGALALFSRMRYYHSSGTILDEQNGYLDALMYQKAQWYMGRDWRRGVGSLFDFGGSDMYISDAATATKRYPYHNFTAEEYKQNLGPAGYKLIGFESTGTSQTYIIPLMLFSDIFAQDKLAPSFLVAGSRLHLTLNSANHAFICGGNATGTTDFTISKASIHLEQYQLTDAVAKVLSAISATSGLEYPFESIYHTQTQSTDQAVSIQVSRALSRANHVMLVSRRTDEMGVPLKNSICARPILPTENVRYQVQLGGQTIPTQEIEGPIEAFLMANVTMRRMHTMTGNDNNFAIDFLRGGAGILALSLESSSTLEQSGAALSAQRVLLFNFYRSDSGGAGNQHLHVLFTSYVRLATIFLDSVIVRS